MNLIVGHNLNQLRHEASITMNDFARQLSMTASALDDIEAGRTRLDVEAMYKVCQLLDVKPKDLFKSVDVHSIPRMDERLSV